MRRFWWLALLLVLSACSIDPCSIDGNSPTCDTRRTEARATIDSINSDSALRATQASIQIGAEATKQAISVRATKQVVQAEATASAMNTEATRQAIAAVQAQSAVIYRSTQTSVDAEATKIAVGVSGSIERARIERDAMPALAQLNVVVFWFLLPALAVIGLIVFGKRTLTATTQAMTRTLAKNAARVNYGPANDPKIGFLSFNQVTGQPALFITAEGLIGNFADLLTGNTELDRLDVPDTLKLAALVESSKRREARGIAAATGNAPWTVTRSVTESPMPLAAPEPIAPAESPWSAPTFKQLMSQGWRPSSKQMMLGVGKNGSPVYCELEDLLSTGIIGRPKSGKTTTLRWIYAQCILVDAKVIAWDLHRNIVGNLPGAEAYTTARGIEYSTGQVYAEIDRRLTAEEYDARPMMIMADDYPLLAPHVDSVIKTINHIIMDARKVNIFCMVSGQGLPAKLFNGSMARDSLNSLFALRASEDAARMAGIGREMIAEVPNLMRGWAVVTGPVDPQVIAIPDTTREDVIALLPASGAASRATSGPLPNGSGMVSGPLPWEVGKAAETSKKEGVEAGKIDYFDGIEAAEDTARKALVRQMMMDGKSQREMIAEIWGQTGGRGYQEAARELSAIQRELIK